MQAQRRPWSDFASLVSTSHMRPQPQAIPPADLVDMARYRKGERTASGCDVLKAVVAYAYDDLVFDEQGHARHVDRKTLAATPRALHVNKFGKAYHDKACIWLHKAMADIVVDAALFMHRTYGWTCVLYDGLRTVDGAYIVYTQMSEADRNLGIFALPGASAHNKGMAADMVMFDAHDRLVAMGGNFDHLDMRTNSRTCTDLPREVLENRIRREIAFQHAALSHGRLFAPLRSEFWDERFPENHQDHWRVLDSIARCLGKSLLSGEDEANRASPKGSPERDAFIEKWEQMDYARFTQLWQQWFDDSELRSVLNLPVPVALPPDASTVIYHGDYNPIYDRDLLASGKNITDGMLDKNAKKKPA